MLDISLLKVLQAMYLKTPYLEAQNIDDDPYEIEAQIQRPL